MSRVLKRLYVGDTGEMLHMLDIGPRFIQTEDWKLSWEEGDGWRDIDSNQSDGPIKGWDVEGIMQLTVDGEGRMMLDRDRMPDGSAPCIAWSADGKRKRIINRPQITRLTHQESEACLRLVRESVRDAVRQAKRVAAERARHIEMREIIAHGLAEVKAEFQAERADAKKSIDQIGALVAVTAGIDRTTKETRDLLPPVVTVAQGNIMEALINSQKLKAELSARDKAVWDCMVETGYSVNATSAKLKADGWKSVSPASVSNVLRDKIDPLFSGGVNPFLERRKHQYRPPTPPDRSRARDGTVVSNLTPRDEVMDANDKGEL